MTAAIETAVRRVTLNGRRYRVAVLRRMLILPLLLFLSAACSDPSADGDATTRSDNAPDAEAASDHDVSTVIAQTRAVGSGTAAGILITTNPDRFLKGDFELRYDGDDRQSSVSVGTTNTGLGAVVIDSSRVDGVGAQRWPGAGVWVEADPQMPDVSLSTQLDHITDAIENATLDFVSCPSNITGIDGYCATLTPSPGTTSTAATPTPSTPSTDLDLLHTLLETFNISRRYLSIGPVEVTVWINRSSELLEAVFVNAADATDDSGTPDEITYELRYFELGEPATFSDIEIACGGLETESSYTECLLDLGVTNAPPWAPASS